MQACEEPTLRVEVTESDKHSSLLLSGKKRYSVGPCGETQASVHILSPKWYKFYEHQ